MSHLPPRNIVPKKSAPPENQRASITRFFLWILTEEFKLLAVSLFFVGFGLYELAREELSIRQWEKTQGTVVESQTEWLNHKEGAAPLRVHVRYRYTVEDREYESSRITTGEPVFFHGVQEAAAFRKRFPPGAPITVLYAPYAPSQATLFAERSSGPWILLGIGLPILLLAIYSFWRRHRSGEELVPDIDIPLHWP